MPERPLLMLPSPRTLDHRPKLNFGGGKLHQPSRERQEERLEDRFKELQQALEKRRARLTTEVQGLAPEEVVVLEAVVPIDGFINAAEKITGMEWLGEIEEVDIPPDDDFFAINQATGEQEQKPLRGRLFLIFTNQQALRQMLSLWTSWKAGEKLPRGLARWSTLFGYLRDVRRWGIRDRLLETGILNDWRERAANGQDVVPCEIELWYRQTPDQRRRSRDRVTELVEAQGGKIVTEAVINEISYHALIARLPISSVRPLFEEVSTDAELVHCEQVQFFRAAGQMTAEHPDNVRQEDAWLSDGQAPSGSAVVALLDGLPLQTHRRLEGRLIIDDPDGFESQYPADERNHGTAMASLILHGDIGSGEAPLSRPIYVRPILQPDARDWRRPRPETMPEDILAVDLLHRAIRRMFETSGPEPPVARDIAAINFSIGILDRPFDGSLSPLARLIDWLAWNYHVLFIISAGNCSQEIQLDCKRAELASLSATGLQSCVIRAVAADARNRRLLSPSEAINALTIGAVHDDTCSEGALPNWLQPFADRSLPSPVSRQGMGYRRAVKPDLLAPGGRVLLQESFQSSDRASLRIFGGSMPPGLVVASPGAKPGDTNATRHVRGTSNATALVTRAANILYDVLEELRKLPGGEIIDTIPRSVWIKTLLAHGSDWGPAASLLEDFLKTPENSRQFKEYITRILGYGRVDITKVQECTAYRATAIGCGVIKKDHSDIHSFPLPPSLSGQVGLRRLAITLAWLTPINPRHQGWRRASLWFSPPKEPLQHIARQQADWKAVRRGTLQHEILEGEDSSVYIDGSTLEVQVSCKADAGTLDEEIPYALVTTLEVAPEIGVSIYDEIRARIQDQVRVTAAQG